METLLLSKFFAIMYLVIGIALISNPKQLKKGIDSLFKNDGILLFIGIFSIFLGAFLVTYHNKWGNPWEIFISIIGYIAILKGFLYAAFPSKLAKIAKLELKTTKSTRLLGLVCILVSAGFFYKALWCGCLG